VPRLRFESASSRLAGERFNHYHGELGPELLNIQSETPDK
jgi:hypothetical protein